MVSRFFVGKAIYNHLLFHKIIWKMRICFTYKALRQIAHPNIHNVGADVLLTDRSERVEQAEKSSFRYAFFQS